MNTDTGTLAYLEHRAWVSENPLRLWRKERGLSQFAVASLLGVSHFSIASWENGASRPRGENMTRIAKLMSNPQLSADWDAWWHTAVDTARAS